MCILGFSGRKTAFPWSWRSAGQQKKPDSEASRSSIVGERIPRWLCKPKPSIAEQAENQLSLQSVPSAWLVALWNLTESEGGDGAGRGGHMEKPTWGICHFSDLKHRRCCAVPSCGPLTSAADWLTDPTLRLHMTYHCYLCSELPAFSTHHNHTC